MERAANEKSLELKDEETLQKVEKSILDERVAGSKRAQAGSGWGSPSSEVNVPRYYAHGLFLARLLPCRC